MITEAQANQWIHTLKEAWTNKDSDLAVSIFAEDAEYRATPFREPMIGKEAIYKYWKDGTDVQENLVLDYEVLATKDNYAIAHFSGSVVQDGVKQLWDGIWQIIFNDEGKAQVFKEWWVTE